MSILKKTLPTLTSIAFLSVLSLIYLAAFLIIAYIATFILAQSWCFFVNILLQPKNLDESFLAGQAFFTFGILLLLLFSGFNGFHESENTIQYSKFYLSRFTKLEDAISLWLNIRFYLAIIGGIFFVIYSIKSLINICSIDVALLITPEPDIYIGKYLGEAKLLLTNNIAITLLLSVISYTFIYFTGKQKELPFLQAILLVSVATSLVVINWLGYLQITMSAFINSFLLTSILACIVCLFNSNINGNLETNLHLLKKGLLLPLPAAGQKEYLRSFLIFLTSANLLHWSVLFNYSVEHDNLKISNWFHLLLVCFWCYLAFRFLRLSASYECSGQKENLVPIPISPVLVYNIYLKPVFKIFFLSWNLCFDLRKSNAKKISCHKRFFSSGPFWEKARSAATRFSPRNSPLYGRYRNFKDTFYSFFIVLLNPTIGLKPTLSSAETGFTVTIASPSETKGWLDAFGSFIPILTPALKWADILGYKQEIAQAQLQAERLVAPAQKLIDTGRISPEIEKHLEAGINPIFALQVPVLKNEEKVELIEESIKNFGIAAHKIQSKYGCCKGSPRTGIIRPSLLPDCYESYYKELSLTAAIETAGNAAKDVAEKAL